MQGPGKSCTVPDHLCYQRGIILIRDTSLNLTTSLIGEVTLTSLIRPHITSSTDRETSGGISSLSFNITSGSMGKQLKSIYKSGEYERIAHSLSKTRHDPSINLVLDYVYLLRPFKLICVRYSVARITATPVPNREF